MSELTKLLLAIQEQFELLESAVGERSTDTEKVRIAINALGPTIECALKLSLGQRGPRGD